MSSFTLELVTGPVIEAVTLAEAKRHLRIDPLVTVDDLDISMLITAAREWIEDYTGRVLIDSTWRLTVGDYILRDTVGDVVQGNAAAILMPSVNGVMLRRSPVISLGAIASIGADGVATEVQDVGSPAAGHFELREAASKWPRVVGLSGAPTLASGTFTIEFRAGFAAGLGSPLADPDPALVPARFKQAMKLWIEANYDRDERMMPLLLETAERLIKPERADLQFA
jgi:hypothetical protein